MTEITTAGQHGYVVGDKIQISFPRPPWWRFIARFRAWLWRRRFAVQEQKTYYVVSVEDNFHISTGEDQPPVEFTSSGSETLH